VPGNCPAGVSLRHRFFKLARRESFSLPGKGFECVLNVNLSQTRTAVTNCFSVSSTLSPRIIRGDKVALVDLHRVAAVRVVNKNLRKLFANLGLVK